MSKICIMEPVLWIPGVPKFTTTQLKLTISSYENTALIFWNVSNTTYGVLEDLLSFQGRERKNNENAGWDFPKVARLLLGLGHEKS